MIRNKSRPKRRSLLTNSIFSHDDLSETSDGIDCRNHCLARNRSLYNIGNIDDDLASYRLRSTLISGRDITIDSKPTQSLRFMDELGPNEVPIGKCKIDCNHTRFLQRVSLNRDCPFNERAIQQQQQQQNQHRVDNTNVRQERLLNNKQLARGIRLHHLERQKQLNSCCLNNRGLTMVDDDTVNATFAPSDLSDVAEIHQRDEQHRKMSYDEMSKHHFFSNDGDRDYGFAMEAKHETDAVKKQLKRAGKARQILKIKPKNQQQHNDLDNLNQLNRQDLCELAKRISNKSKFNNDLDGKTDSSLRPLEFDRRTDLRDYYALSCNCYDENKLKQIKSNQQQHEYNHQCYDENVIKEFDIPKAFEHQKNRQQQTAVKFIDSDNIDEYFLKRINELTGEHELTGDLSLLNSKSLATLERTIKSRDELNLTSLKVTSGCSNNEIKSTNKLGNSRTNYGADFKNNKPNAESTINNLNNSDETKTEKENTPLTIEKKLSSRAVKSAKTLPASLKKIGNIFSGQAEPGELIEKLRQLDNQDKSRLDQKRKSYKSMNWSHIANIYKHQKPTKTRSKNSENSKVAKLENTTNKSDNRKYHNSSVIGNPMYLNKLNGNINNPSDPGFSRRNSNQDSNNNNIIRMDCMGQSTICSKLKRSCICQLMVNSIHNLFPILHAFDDYSVPSDLIGDLFTGLTIAILQVPQGMAYGMLAGVDPIYGLYVSLIPVLVMAFMSKSRHVSYGTFAIISILLASSTESIRSKIELTQRSLLVVGPRPTVDDNNLVLNQASRIGSKQQEQIIASLASNDPLILTLPTDTDNSIVAQQQSSLLVNNFAPTNIEILTTICITVGILQILMALFRLGHLAVIFSDQLVSSFTCASAFHVLTSQLAGLFDVDTPAVSEGLFKVCRTWWHVFQALLHNNSDNTPESIPSFNYYTAMLSLISIIFLLGVKEILEPCLRARYTKMVRSLPSELILMTCIVFSSWYWQFNQNFGVRIVGHIPTGFPAPKLPPVELIPYALQDAVTIALISFAMNLSLAQVYAKRFRYKMDSNQELFALGSSNLVGSFFSCFPCASSLSRSALQSNLNVKSPLTPIFSCAIVFSMIAYFAPILHDLPKSTLSCIIIIALKGVIMQFRDLIETWRLSKLDASTWLVTFWAVIAFGVTYGLVIGIMSSLLTIFFRILTPNYTILGQLPGTDIYVDKSAFEDCEEIEQVRIFRFNSPLCYMNRTMFRSRVESALPDVFYKLNYVKLFCPKRRKIDLERDHILACNHHHQHHIATTTTTIINGNTNNNYGGLGNKNTNTRVRYFIIDCSALAYCDHAGATLLLELIQELEDHKVTVYLAACPIKLVLMFERMGSGSILESHVYPTITAAVNQARFLRDSSGTNNFHNSLSIYCHQ